MEVEFNSRPSSVAAEGEEYKKLTDSTAAYLEGPSGIQKLTLSKNKNPNIKQKIIKNNLSS